MAVSAINPIGVFLGSPARPCLISPSSRLSGLSSACWASEPPCGTARPLPAPFPLWITFSALGSGQCHQAEIPSCAQAELGPLQSQCFLQPQPCQLWWSLLWWLRSLQKTEPLKGKVPVWGHSVPRAQTEQQPRERELSQCGGREDREEMGSRLSLA